MKPIDDEGSVRLSAERRASFGIPIVRVDSLDSVEVITELVVVDGLVQEVKTAHIALWRLGHSEPWAGPLVADFREWLRTRRPEPDHVVDEEAEK